MTASPTDSTATGPTSGRALVTIIGADRVGIIAGIANVLAEANVNILDITQSVMREFFTMIMMVDLAGSRLPFEELSARLRGEGRRARRAGGDPARGYLQGHASNLSQHGGYACARCTFRPTRSSRPSRWCRSSTSTSAPSPWASACATASATTSSRLCDKHLRRRSPPGAPTWRAVSREIGASSASRSSTSASRSRRSRWSRRRASADDFVPLADTLDARRRGGGRRLHRRLLGARAQGHDGGRRRLIASIPRGAGGHRARLRLGQRRHDARRHQHGRRRARWAASSGRPPSSPPTRGPSAAPSSSCSATASRTTRSWPAPSTAPASRTASSTSASPAPAWCARAGAAPPTPTSARSPAIIKRTAFKITRVGELVGPRGLGAARRAVRHRRPVARADAGEGDCVARILEAMGVERVGAPGRPRRSRCSTTRSRRAARWRRATSAACPARSSRSPRTRA